VQPSHLLRLLQLHQLDQESEFHGPAGHVGRGASAAASGARGLMPKSTGGILRTWFGSGAALESYICRTERIIDRDKTGITSTTFCLFDSENKYLIDLFYFFG